MAKTRTRGRPTTALAGAIAEQIVVQALKSFRRAGFEATTIDHVAIACRVSKHTIYRRFPTKRDLFVAALDYDRQGFLARLNGLEIETESTLERLRRTCLELFELVVSPGNTDLYRACIGAAPRHPEIGAHFRESERRIQDVIEPLVQQAQDEKLLIEGDSRRLTRQLYYATIGEVWLHALLGSEQADDETTRETIFNDNWAMFIAAFGKPANRLSP
ncbi:TetR/AcrR family transcriptional regulator [Brucella anthropi]|uniref:TetR/AcrR family transcriptional regulator n=1 Tax=Brucella anthropi TaxID=529 RepID=UPI0021570571|nr:TetR/AcrR family transcriptional regulator [Brucella anthropi]MCR8492646.1 TetR/AcrR family transcriptional regulator [Brucella anthropi]